MIKMSYDPTNIEPHKGKTFVTRHRYSIDFDGRILGRPSIEGAKVLHVAGFDSRHYWSFVECLDYGEESKQRFDKLISEVGEEPRPGLRLVISLTPEFSREKRRNGLITSRIEDIV